MFRIFHRSRLAEILFLEIVLSFEGVSIGWAWVNPGFESGSLTGWTTSTGSAVSMVCLPDASLVFSGPATNSNGGLNMTHSGLYAAQLFSGRGDSGHLDWASIQQTDTVPSNGQCCLSFWFAGVFEDYHFRKNDLSGDTFLKADILVGGSVVASVSYSWANNLGQIVVDGLTGNGVNGACTINGSPNDWGYLPWTQYTINLCQYAGQQATLRVTDFDCDLGGHYGYGFLDDVSWISCPTPQVTLVKSNNPSGLISAGQTITYTLTYANAGTSPIDGVVINDTVPAGTTYVPNSMGSSPNIPITAIVGNDLIWNVGYLYPGNSGTLTFQAVPDTCGETIINVAAESNLETARILSNAVTNMVAPCTPTPTATVLVSPTPTFTFVFTGTSTFTRTATASATSTASFTTTSTQTFSPTKSFTASFTSTNSVTSTKTFTPVFTSTSTFTSTYSLTPIPTATATSTPSFSSTRTPTTTFTITRTPTSTYTSTYSFTPTVTFTPTNSPTATPTMTSTHSFTATSSFTSTYSSTQTRTSTHTFTATSTSTSTNTFTSTPTSTSTFTSTNTYTPTWTYTSTVTSTPTKTFTFTHTSTFTFTFTATSTPTNTYTPTPGVQLQKSASELSARMGDTITYTLSLTVSGSTASHVTIVDTLPTEVVFVSFGSPSIPALTMQEIGQTLTWTFPPLPPGNYQLPYSVQVKSGYIEGFSLLNRAEASFDGGVSNPVSLEIPVPGPYTVRIGVYNEAGELIKVFPLLTFFQPAANLSLSGTTLTGSSGAVSIFIDGTFVGVWDGNNGSNNPVSNGHYFIKVDNRDPANMVTSITQDVTVSRTFSRVTVNVYNEAGEIVRHLLEQVMDSTNGIVKSIQLSSETIQPNPPVGSVNSASATLLVTLPSSGFSVVWNGTNDQNTIVTNGGYFIEVHWLDDGADQVATRRITVVNGDAAPVQGIVFAQPSLLGQGQTDVVFKINSTQTLTLRVFIFDTAGELITLLKGDPGTNQVAWNAAGLASGVYFGKAELMGMDGGLVARQTVKFLVKH